MTPFTTEAYTADISVADYIGNYRDEARFLRLCQECPNYGNSWGCPPFDYDTETFLQQYKNAHLIALKLTFADRDIPVTQTQEIIMPARKYLDIILLGLEKKYGGRGFSYVGTCLYCKGRECARRFNRPCLHPELVRPSLEAYGFDIGRTLSELFGIELKWGHDGKLPPYLVLVGGFFHNADCPV